MARKGGNKKRCEQYRMSGHREENKKKKQEKHQRRVEHFAKRKENGQSYTYSKEITEEKRKLGVNVDFNPYWDQILINKSHKGRYTEVSKWKSIMRKLNNEVAKEKAAMKEAEKNSQKREKGR